MRSRLIVPLVLLFAIIALLQQVKLYFTQQDELLALLQTNKTVAQQLAEAAPGENGLRQQLGLAGQRHAELREILPGDLATEEFLHYLSQLAEQQGIKILASSEALYSRPHYREAVLNISLEASLQQVQLLLQPLTTLSRVISIDVPQQSGKKNTNFRITLYAADLPSTTVTALTACQKMPKGLWLPPLRSALRPLFEEYLVQCQYINAHGELYLLQRQLQGLQQENEFLEQLIAQLSPATRE